MRRRYVIMAFVAILTIFGLTGSPLFGAKLAVSRGLANVFSTLTPNSELKLIIDELQRENADLKAELLSDFVSPKGSIVVFSSYPFNSRSEVVISAGRDAGIEEGDIVTVGKNLLVGKVKKVFDKTSIVSTIFDPSFEAAVRVGKESVNALLKGGNELTLELIPNDAELQTGEIVFTAGTEFPYGLSIGTIRDIGSGKGGAFKVASVTPNFEFKSLRNVNILN